LTITFSTVTWPDGGGGAAGATAAAGAAAQEANNDNAMLPIAITLSMGSSRLLVIYRSAAA
jgi:hypothetical protein